MPVKRPSAAVAAVIALSLTAACGGEAGGAGSDGDGLGGRTDAAARSGYPVKIENCGTTQVFNEAPSRVVVTDGASVAEVSTLLALGLGDKIVANQQSYGASEVPGRVEAIKELPTGGVKRNDAFGVPRESMIGLRPDLVLSTTSYGFDPKNGFANRDELRDVGARSYISPQGCHDENSKLTIEDSYRLLRDMGRIFHVSDRAEKIIAASRKRIAAIASKVKGKKKPKVMMLFTNMSMGSNDFSSVVAKGIYNDILGKAGAVNAFADASKTSFADLSKEKVAATDVDALVVIAYQDPNPAAYAEKLLKEFPQWPAAKNHTYVTLSDSIYLSPDNDRAVERLAKKLHPEAF
ncbi:ABC transporter substrate-binding protein [Streptomyces formicae]|uniref:ABC transporter (Iron.B12.siderophore.hemin), periplasmic substrate-binding component n=1 Tax=Streptomyces formicae TaxID=1616117 RepID=A0A291Q1L7_9ACTN|nr:ABC transporter substrate-binding protein [Streptomyces formicae]ATL25631.1 ABC transporter (iron.B12.siderophore.hemin), periplasmic substrate-binding component [Streptomyces formicae]